ncbi:hypothetical protein E2562_024502, partial [Oryza meyeriana var. granulata]
MEDCCREAVERKNEVTAMQEHEESSRGPDQEDEIDEDADDGAMFLTSESGEILRPTSRSSVKHVSSVISKMSNEKKDLVKEIGFGGLLKLPHLNKLIFLDNINLGPLNIRSGLKPLVAGLTCETMRKMIMAASTIRTCCKLVEQKPQHKTVRRTYSDCQLGQWRNMTTFNSGQSSRPAVQFNTAPVKGKDNNVPLCTTNSSSVNRKNVLQGYLPPNPLSNFIHSMVDGK